MKINEIIREKRVGKKLTQEQVAVYLGVTTPAVNKWEKGTSYPDITLLPALARLLDTDLNTLLSFKDDLSEMEITLFMNNLSEISYRDGFEKAYDISMEKIKEFPTCYPLILNVAFMLDGALMMNKDIEDIEKYKKAIESLYERSLSSEDSAIQNRAKSILISRFMQNKEYNKAEELLESLPDESPVDKKQLQANLYIDLGKLEEAAKIEEEKLLSATNEINTVLMTLMEIAIKENRIEDAEYIANVYKKGSELFDLWEYNSYVAHFQLYTSCKNRIKCLKILAPMLEALTHKWDINKSPLYRHIKTKNIDEQFGPQIQKAIINSIYTDEETSFLKDSEEVQELLKKY